MAVPLGWHYNPSVHTELGLNVHTTAQVYLFRKGMGKLLIPWLGNNRLYVTWIT